MKKLLFILLAWLTAVGIAFAAVDINTASEAELDKLPGIGPVKAKAIVAERQKNGPFKSVDDLKRVKGIGDKVFDKLKSEITVSGGGAKPAAAKPAAAVAPAAPATAPAKPEAKAAAAPAAKPAEAKKEDKAAKPADAKKDEQAAKAAAGKEAKDGKGKTAKDKAAKDKDAAAKDDKKKSGKHPKDAKADDSGKK